MSEAPREREEAPRPAGGVREKAGIGVGRAYGQSMGDAGPYLFVGIQIAGAMGLFVAAGYFVDEWLDSSPWFLLLGCMLGMVAVVASLVRAIHDLEAHEKRRRHMRAKADSEERKIGL